MGLSYYDFPTEASIDAPPATGPLLALADGRLLAAWIDTESLPGRWLVQAQIRDSQTGDWDDPRTLAVEAAAIDEIVVEQAQAGGLSLSYRSFDTLTVATFDAGLGSTGLTVSVDLPGGTSDAIRRSDGTYLVATSVLEDAEGPRGESAAVVTTVTALDSMGRAMADPVEVARQLSPFDFPAVVRPSIRATDGGLIEILTFVQGDDFEFSSSESALISRLTEELEAVGPVEFLDAPDRLIPRYRSVEVLDLEDGRTVYAWANRGVYLTLREADGTLGDLVEVLPSNGRSAVDIAIAEDRDGGLVVLSGTLTGGAERGQVIATQLDADGQRISDTLLSLPSTENALSLDIAKNGLGVLLARWNKVVPGESETRETLLIQRIIDGQKRLVPLNNNEGIGTGNTFQNQQEDFDPEGVYAFMAGGDDQFIGRSGPDTLQAGTGDDRADGMGGADFLDGSDGDDTLDGGTNNDTLVGGSGDDQLFGNTGDDWISGEQGADTLDGGSGADLLIGGQGSDRFIVDNVRDVVVESRSWAGSDTVEASVDFRMGRKHIEDLVLTGEARLGAGNGLMNEIRGNRADNVLDGGKNNDTLMGGAGNDTYLVRAPGDLVIEAAGRGNADVVLAFRAYALTANVERLYLQTLRNDAGEGVSGINGIGNTLDNLIVGNPFDNVIAGREGSDTLKGQAGADTFVFDRPYGAGNIDRIIDFNVNTEAEGDSLLFKQDVFRGIARGALDASQFVEGKNALDQDDRFIFDVGSGALWFDIDGVGGTRQHLIATFEQNAIVTFEDITLF